VITLVLRWLRLCLVLATTCLANWPLHH
jgi:hypothetical protein